MAAPGPIVERSESDPKLRRAATTTFFVRIRDVPLEGRPFVVF